MDCVSSKIHVLQVINTLGVGGAERYAVRLANEIEANGMRVTVAASAIGSQLRQQLNPAVEYLDLPMQPVRGRPLQLIKNAARVPSELSRYIRDEGVDLVHTHQPTSGLWAWLAAHHRAVPVVHTLMNAYSVSGLYERLMYRINVPQSMVTVFHGLSDYLSGELRTEFRVPHDRVHTIVSGVDTSLFAPADQSSARRIWGIAQDRFVVGMCSRLHPDKRVDLAIKSHAILVKTVRHALLVIAGGGSEGNSLVCLAEDLGIRDSVMFLGEIQRVNQLVPAFDAYLQTTKGPNMGLSVLEALACGKPVVIAADSGRETTMGRATLCGLACGVVVQSSPQLLAEAVTRIAQDPDLLSRMGRTAREVAVTRYEWGRHVSEMADLYKSLVDA